VLKTILVITSLWGMWGQPDQSSTPSSQGRQETSYHRADKASSGQHWKKPGRWCGWWMRKRMGVSHPRYNLARNWAQWGRPATPQIGAVVVWRHHVGLIVGQNSKGQWLIQSGNDGGKVKTRPWNLSKVIAYRI
jgi:hypothetical protein